MTDIELFAKSINFVTLDEKQIEKITARIPEFYRASYMIGHSTSQGSYSLQTLNMMDDSPFSRLKQCLSQINKRKQALQENYFIIEHLKLEIRKLSKKKFLFIPVSESSRLKIRENEAKIKTISMYMENALRQLGMFQDMYDSIMEHHKIRKDWTEKDFEAQEVQNMIRKAFRLAIQDMMSGTRLGKAAVEYFEQLGIHPQTAMVKVIKFLDGNLTALQSKELEIDVWYKFLDEMAEYFKDAHKKALARIGLDELGSTGFMAGGATKPE